MLTRPAGEARFANVRKLQRLAAEFEGREGRDLRGLLDFLAARAESNAEALAATAVEGHDGVRIMTVHNAKGLEFGVVAVPDLTSFRPALVWKRGRLVARDGTAIGVPRVPPPDWMRGSVHVPELGAEAFAIPGNGRVRVIGVEAGQIVT